ncbi:uncharacterized [Tachysurus ichikawai]
MAINSSVLKTFLSSEDSFHINEFETHRINDYQHCALKSWKKLSISLDTICCLSSVRADQRTESDAELKVMKVTQVSPPPPRLRQDNA